LFLLLDFDSVVTFDVVAAAVAVVVVAVVVAMVVVMDHGSWIMDYYLEKAKRNIMLITQLIRHPLL
jgi:hypothetical protein